MNTSWNHQQPRNIKDLWQFYHGYVKLLYSEIQTQNSMPAEMLFEIHAVLDHISRHWVYDENEERVVAEAYSHFKRSCLDVFKLKVKEAREQYDLLRRIDTSVIDNGDFDRQLHPLFSRIKELATEARRLEGMPDSENRVPAFDLWEQVYDDCVKLEKDFFVHPKLNWARRRGIRGFIRQNIWGFVFGVLSSLAATVLWYLITFQVL